MIYCKDCKHFREMCCEYGCSRRCILDDSISYDDEVSPQKIYGSEKQLRERNKFNNCPDFVQATWWDKIRRWW